MLNLFKKQYWSILSPSGRLVNESPRTSESEAWQGLIYDVTGIYDSKVIPQVQLKLKEFLECEGFFAVKVKIVEGEVKRDCK